MVVDLSAYLRMDWGSPHPCRIKETPRYSAFAIWQAGLGHPALHSYNHHFSRWVLYGHLKKIET